MCKCDSANLFDVDRLPMEARFLNVGRHVGDLVPDLGEFLTTKPRRRKHGRKRAPLGFPDAFERRLAQHELYNLIVVGRRKPSFECFVEVFREYLEINESIIHRVLREILLRNYDKVWCLVS